MERDTLSRPAIKSEGGIFIRILKTMGIIASEEEVMPPPPPRGGVKIRYVRGLTNSGLRGPQL